MKHLVLITSVINTPNKPLSYTNKRSIYTHEERFEQTKKTIQSVQNKLPDSTIFIVECSLLSDEQELFLKKNSSHFLNLYDNESIRNNVYGVSKSLGEGTMTYYALEYIQNNYIVYDDIIKISGRYFLSNQFDSNKFNNDSIIAKMIDGNKYNILTALYKIPKHKVNSLLLFLNNSFDAMTRCIGYEELFAKFINSTTDIIYINPIGLEGPVSVSTDYYRG